MRGLFITFEGGEGSGKTTQIQRLKVWIEKNYEEFSLCLTREPGGTEDAESIRGLLLNGLVQKWQPATEAMLVSASRYEHVFHVIQPALQRGNIVICDRFIDSTIAYQVYGKKVNANFIEKIHSNILNGIKPNMTFLLKVTPSLSRKRLKKRKSKNRYDNFAQSFYTKAQKSFLKIAKNKKNYFILNSSFNNNELERKILKIVLKRLKIK